jgi:hypothetical protein
VPANVRDDCIAAIKRIDLAFRLAPQLLVWSDGTGVGYRRRTLDRDPCHSRVEHAGRRKTDTGDSKRKNALRPP